MIKEASIPSEFKPLFWDVDFESIDPQKHKTYIICRMYNKGFVPGIVWVEKTYSYDEIRESVRASRDLTTLSANYLKNKYSLKKTDMVYYQQNQNIFWER